MSTKFYGDKQNKKVAFDIEKVEKNVESMLYLLKKLMSAPYYSPRFFLLNLTNLLCCISFIKKSSTIKT